MHSLKTAAMSLSPVSSLGILTWKTEKTHYQLTLGHIRFFCQKANASSETPLQMASLSKVADMGIFLHCKRNTKLSPVGSDQLTQTKLEFQQQDGNSGFCQSHCQDLP